MELIPKDTIILFSSGEYSNYHVMGLYRALKDIDSEELRNEYINLHPEVTAQYSFRSHKFIEFLREKGIIEEVPRPKWVEWFMCSYSNISEMMVYDEPLMFT